MKSASFENVVLRRGHLAEKEKLARRVTIDAVYRQFTESGRIGAFKCNRKWEDGKRPHFFWDSDVAKWMEGAAYRLKCHPSAFLQKKVEAIIDDIEANMQEDGYFNIFHMTVEPGTRWTSRDHHELYCAGHLLEAAIAYYEATGRRRFLDLMERFTEHIYNTFFVERSAAFYTPGHQEIELALLRLYRLNGNAHAFELARFFIESRGAEGTKELLLDNDFYAQDDHPIREMREAVGHAVRALYYYSAAAEYGALTGDGAVLNSCRAIFENITNHKMYVTGGLGFPHGEAFCRESDFLPNDTAYAETCASIAMVYFCARMLNIDRDAKYADVIERQLYNGVVSGISLSGDAFFYENPLAINRKARSASQKTVRYSKIIERVEDFSCSCCPPNLCRFLTSLGSLVYSTEGEDLYINQYADSEAEFEGIKISQKTAYPSSGRIIINASGAARIFLRIPDWCSSFKLNIPYTSERGYAVIEDVTSEIILELDMPTRILRARATVADCEGRVAVSRGPVVYCIEEVDNGAELDAIYLDRRTRFSVRKEALFGSLPVLYAHGYRRKIDGALYSDDSDSSYTKESIKLIPYCCHANRGASDMLVWMNIR